ncbi:nuclear transport factor 2 family protein [Loktanella sp. S4079]|uniref:nuclear transport factor 2 family protein n=1 Tax=Loktanella sp. S4079 TaxID=579483 RepID=UPI000697B7D2|nr:nuclear transport factor 2 family protein [Loktanella sp. S4079]
MTQAIENFFAAWALQDPTEQSKAITDCMAENGIYSDPRSGGRLSGAQEIARYIRIFSTNAPGWTATVTKSDSINNYTRAIVKFSGKGPDGQEMAQFGTYFTDLDDAGRIIAIAGFVGETPAEQH